MKEHFGGDGNSDLGESISSGFIQIGLPYWACTPSFLLSIFSSSSLVFRSLIIICLSFDFFGFILFGVGSTSWPFTKFGKIFSHYFLEYFFNPVLFHLPVQDSDHINIKYFVVVPQVPMFQTG